MKKKNPQQQRNVQSYSKFEYFLGQLINQTLTYIYVYIFPFDTFLQEKLLVGPWIWESKKKILVI